MLEVGSYFGILHRNMFMFPFYSVSGLIFSLSVIVFPIVTFTKFEPIVDDMIVSCAFAIGVCVSTGLFFGPKIRMLLYGDNIDLSTRRVPEEKKFFSLPRKVSEVAPSEALHQELPHDAIICADVALKGKTKDFQIALCVEQINLWRQLLIRLGEQDTSSPHNSLPSMPSMPGLSDSNHGAREEGIGWESMTDEARAQQANAVPYREVTASQALALASQQPAQHHQEASMFMDFGFKTRLTSLRRSINSRMSHSKNPDDDSPPPASNEGSPRGNFNETTKRIIGNKEVKSLPEFSVDGGGDSGRLSGRIAKQPSAGKIYAFDTSTTAITGSSNNVSSVPITLFHSSDRQSSNNQSTIRDAGAHYSADEVVTNREL